LATAKLTAEQLLASARQSFQMQAWAAAFAGFSAADEQTQLEPQDLVQLAQVALLTGKEVEGTDTLARAHQAFLNCGQLQFAVRCAFWLGFTLLLRGEAARGGGWLGRAARILDGHPECAENGYLLLAEGYRLFHSNDAAKAWEMFSHAAVLGERFADKDLLTLGLQGQGRALIRQGEVSRGVALLDEAMIAVTAGEVSPLSAGGVYCSVLEACSEIFDLQRAQEWTAALERWCDSQPDIVPYRGHCLVRRAELAQMRGSWAEALESAQQASEWLTRDTPKPGAGAAYYQVGEVLRLRGNFAASEEAYQQASRLYRCPGPGVAQLRLAQGRVDAACALIRRLLEEVHEAGPRVKVLAAHAEIALAANDISAASAAADELERIAARWDIPFLHALYSYTRGAVLLAADRAPDAFAELRRSWSLWHELSEPYEAARAQVLTGRACQRMGDEESALLEFRAACDAFRRLGANVDLACAEALLTGSAHQPACPLTARETQVLRLVAAGMTNRAIAVELRISEKTVARHLSNIFTKLDLPSRTAAAAYAFERSLV
jgi:DNA-binding CsgD family transcriptional regulator